MSVPARWWMGDLDEGQVEVDDKSVLLEVERNDPNEIVVHTMMDERGSYSSYYLDRESALRLGLTLLQEAMLR